MNETIYGTKVVRHEPLGHIALDFGPPLKWWERALQATLCGLAIATLGVLTIISAMANPEIFATIFGVTFAVAIFSIRR